MRKKMLTFSGTGREWEQQYRGWPSMTIPASINRTGAYETRHHASMDKHYVNPWMYFRKLIITRSRHSFPHPALVLINLPFSICLFVLQSASTCARAAGVTIAAFSSGASPNLSTA